MSNMPGMKTVIKTGECLPRWAGAGAVEEPTTAPAGLGPVQGGAEGYPPACCTIPFLFWGPSMPGQGPL